MKLLFTREMDYSNPIFINLAVLGLNYQRSALHCDLQITNLCVIIRTAGLSEHNFTVGRKNKMSLKIIIYHFHRVRYLYQPIQLLLNYFDVDR